jgi:hypothetical protein
MSSLFRSATVVAAGAVLALPVAPEAQDARRPYPDVQTLVSNLPERPYNGRCWGPEYTARWVQLSGAITTQYGGRPAATTSCDEAYGLDRESSPFFRYPICSGETYASLMEGEFRRRGIAPMQCVRERTVAPTSPARQPTTASVNQCIRRGTANEYVRRERTPSYYADGGEIPFSGGPSHRQVSYHTLTNTCSYTVTMTYGSRAAIFGSCIGPERMSTENMPAGRVFRLRDTTQQTCLTTVRAVR